MTVDTMLRTLTLSAVLIGLCCNPSEAQSSHRTMQSVLAKPARKSTNKSSNSTKPKSRTRYIFVPNRHLSYAVDIVKTRAKSSSQRWLGTITFKTGKGSSRLSSGNYGAATLIAGGSLKGYRRESNKWIRDKSEDIAFENPKVVFGTSGVHSYKLDSFGRRTLPADMHLRFGVLEAIFPNVPDVQRSGEETRKFWLSKSHSLTGKGSGGMVTGKASFDRKSIGSNYTMNETVKAGSKSNPVFTYVTKQEANFVRGEMTSSSTVFAIHWGNMAKVTVKASRTSTKHVGMTAIEKRS